MSGSIRSNVVHLKPSETATEQTRKRNRELTGIFIGGRELTVVEWKQFIWSEVRKHITLLSRSEILDLIATYHPTSHQILKHSPREIRSNRALPVKARERLCLIRESGDPANSVYEKTGESLINTSGTVNRNSLALIALRVTRGVPVWLKVLTVFSPIIFVSLFSFLQT